MKALHILSLLIFFLSNLKGSHSFSQPHGFTTVPAPGGRWGSEIISASQDAKGYMWFGAFGVHRYDGYNYTSYFHDPMNPSSLAYDRVEVILADHNGFIWVGTNGMGLDRLDPETGIFTHFRHDPSDSNSISGDRISALLEDRDGKIWVGTEYWGLNCVDPKTGTVTHFRHDPGDTNSLSYDNVTTLYEDRQGTIWIGTGLLWHGGNLRLRDSTLNRGGLNRFDQASKNFTHYLHNSNDPSSLIDNRVRAIFEDSKGTFWVGTSGDGLHTMNRAKGSFERHRFNALNPEGLSRPPVRSTLPWVDDMITFIREDGAGTIWIGTLMGGLNRYDPKTRKVNHYISLNENSKDPWSFYGSYTSKDGVFWLITGEGVHRMDPSHKQIPHYDVGSPVNVMIQDKSGKLWLGSDNPNINNQGLLWYDADGVNKKRFGHDPSDPKSLSSNTVYSMLEDSKGTVWIGTQNGLNQYDRQLQKFTRYLSSGHNYGITAIFEDRNGSLWLGTNVANEGLILMNREGGTFTHYMQAANDSISSGSRGISCIKEDKVGQLWIGTFEGEGGLHTFDRSTEKSQHYLPGLNIWEIFEDAEGVLWVGTSKGLYYFNRSKNDFVPFYNQATGLTENIGVFHVLQDDQQSLWIATTKGLFRLKHNGREISFFGERQGINQYSDGVKGKGGELFYGSANGYYAFFPDQLTGNTVAPDLNISEFRLGNEVVSPGNGSPLTLPISQTKEIRLRYNENVFSFDFAGIHYSSPEDNSHLFKLENLDNDWRKAGDEKTAYYYNVSPGLYIFRVKAANSDGVEAEKSIVIIISPPWWRTWWAYSMYGVLFIAGVLATHRIQRDRVIKSERERTQEKELAQAKEIEKAYHELKTTQAQLVQREKMASLGELAAGIAHEIQNPLNFVNNFSELNTELFDELEQEVKKGNLDEIESIAKDIKENQQKINHHGKRADAIVKGMLQHSRSSSGVKEITDINTLVEEHLRLAYHGLRAKDKSFNATMKTDFDETIGSINVIPQDTGRVILNLISNAFYAVGEKKNQTNDGYEPTVSVSTKKIGDKVEVRVMDNGNGIPPNLLDKIFQPFFTTKPTGQGTGLGLSLSYDIIKAHGGELLVETREGDGAVFIIQLPFNQTAV